MQFYDTAWVDDSWLTDESDALVENIRNFLALTGSCLQTTAVLDSDGKLVDMAVLIQQAASANGINPKLLLALMEAEQSALSTCPDQAALANLMGLEPASTAHAQIADAAVQISAAITALKNTGTTPNGWVAGTVKTTLDGVNVTPANDVISVLFDYSQNAGAVWGGSSADEKGVQGIYTAWRDFSLDETLPGYVFRIYFPSFK